jgi:4'-phosphopantetheinyl transferase
MVRIHLYGVGLDSIDAEQRRARCEALLSQDELDRCERFRFERDRLEFLFAHALMRVSLSQHAPQIAPNAWTFALNPFGRPLVAGPKGAPPLYFNLSHTDGFAACVVAPHYSVGVDVQATDLPGATLEIAERFFAPAEVAMLKSLRAEEQRERFFTYWTLKESYIKARGMGLALPLDRFWFTMSPGGPIDIHFAPGFGDDSTRWRFALRRPSLRHQLAVADGSARAHLVESIVDRWWLCGAAAQKEE